MKNIDAAKQRIVRLKSMTDVPLRRKNDWRMEGIKHLLDEVERFLEDPDGDYVQQEEKQLSK